MTLRGMSEMAKPQVNARTAQKWVTRPNFYGTPGRDGLPRDWNRRR
jgi:hypothetical protein